MFFQKIPFDIQNDIGTVGPEQIRCQDRRCFIRPGSTDDQQIHIGKCIKSDGNVLTEISISVLIRITQFLICPFDIFPLCYSMFLVKMIIPVIGNKIRHGHQPEDQGKPHGKRCLFIEPVMDRVHENIG